MLIPQRNAPFNDQYNRVVWAAGYTDQDYARNDQEEYISYEVRRLGANIWTNNAIVTSLIPTISGNTVTFSDGQFIHGGHVIPVPGASFTFNPLNQYSLVMSQVTVTQVDSSLDPTLVDPNTGDPVQDRIQLSARLMPMTIISTAWPAAVGGDALDEPWGQWLDARDMHTICAFNTPGRPMVPANAAFGPWSVASGDPMAFRIGQGRVPMPVVTGGGLQINHTHGVEAALSINVTLQPNTGYYVYLDLRTVYGQPDLTNDANGFFVAINRVATTGPAGGGIVNYSGTTGGSTLLGDYQRANFTFTSDASASPVTVTIGIPANAPTTQINASGLLITPVPLPANVLSRHNYYLFSGLTMTPWVEPRTQLPEMTVDTIYTAKRYLTGDKFGTTNPYYGQYQVSFTLAILGNPQRDSVMRVPSYTGLGPQSFILDINQQGVNGRDQSASFIRWDGAGNGLVDIFAIAASNPRGYTVASPGVIASTRGKIKGPVMPAPYDHYAYLCSIIIDLNGHIYATSVRNNRCWFQGPKHPYRILLNNGYSTIPAPVTAPAYLIPVQTMSYTVRADLTLNNTTGVPQWGYIDFMLNPSATEDGEQGFLMSQAFDSSAAGVSLTKTFMVSIPNAATPAAAQNSFYYQFRWVTAGLDSAHAGVTFSISDFTIDNGTY